MASLEKARLFVAQPDLRAFRGIERDQYRSDESQIMRLEVPDVVTFLDNAVLKAGTKV
jgi:hypothetical protein